MSAETPSSDIRCEQDGSSTAQELESRLRKFNEERAGPVNWKPLVLSIRNSDDELIAGLSGGFFWNTLFVDVLWVDEAHRGKAYGRSLLTFAEREAFEQGYDLVYLSSFGFQAPGFYLRQGYSVVGDLDGLPRGSKRQWFAKRIRRTVV